MRRFFLIALSIVTIILWSSSAYSKEKVYLGKAGLKTIVKQQDFYAPNRIYVIKGICDLGGKTISIPNHSVLDLRKGELRGGSITLKDGVRLINGHTKNLNVNTKGFFTNEIVYIDNQKFAASHFQSVSTKIELLCDLDLASRSSGLSLNGNLNGNGHVLRIAGSSYDLLYLNKDNITIKNTFLENMTTNPKSDCRIILCRASNVLIEKCTLKGAMVFAPSSGSRTPLRNITIKGNLIECDFSHLTQVYGYQHDVMTFRACKNVSIVDNTINAKDVNRVFKTARGWTPDKNDIIKDDSNPCVENIAIENNAIVSNASCGKQFWDMYNGTINPRFVNNTVKCYGHTVVFENKTKDDNGIQSTAFIEGNIIESDWKLFFINSNKNNDSYIIRNNQVVISGTEREHIDLVGQKKNRNYVNSLAGFALFDFEDNKVFGENAGSGLYPFIFQLESGNVVIQNNTFSDLGSILVVDSAIVESIDFQSNVFKPIDEFDYDISISGRVHSVRYHNSNGSFNSAVRMTKAAYDSCSNIEIVAPRSHIQLTVKNGQSFDRSHNKYYKREGVEIMSKSESVNFTRDN